MATATATKTAKPRAVNLNVEIDGNNTYATPTGIRFGLRGKVTSPGYTYARLSKGQARAIRKAARKAGFRSHAAAPREA